MISPHFFSLPISCPKAIFCLFVSCTLFSCTTISNTLLSPTEPQEGESVTREIKRQKVISSQFEWAVQNYEAGDYNRAIPQFRQLRTRGPEFASFPLIPFYLGMSHFHLKQYPEAVEELENFLKAPGERRESLDARMALLASYERLGQWGKVLGLAAETDKHTLFQDSRAFLKLVWARALIEKSEIKGARAALKDASNFLHVSEAHGNRSLDRDRDLWGRFYYTSLLVKSKDCSSSEPRETGSGKNKRRLYQPWLDSTIDCYRKLISELGENLLRTESTWADPAIQHLDTSLQHLGSQLKAYLQQERPNLASYRALETLGRQQLYRLLGRIDETMKNFKNQSVSTPSLEPLRKRVDLLLVSLSHPS